MKCNMALNSCNHRIIYFLFMRLEPFGFSPGYFRIKLKALVSISSTGICKEEIYLIYLSITLIADRCLKINIKKVIDQPHELDESLYAQSPFKAQNPFRL